MKKILHSILLLVSPFLVYAQPGTFDPTFGVSGKALTNFYYDYGDGPQTFGMDEVKAIAVQADGKIIAVGLTYDGITQDFGLVRYNTDGTPDNSFGVNGTVTTAFGTLIGALDRALAVTIQPDGKIVAAGVSNGGVTGPIKFAVVRYNTDGSPDASFGVNGIVITDFGGNSAIANAVAIQPDGKIVVAGEVGQPGSGWDFAVVRYNADGSLDNSFDSDGKVITTITTQNDELYAMSLQPDGKIVAAGYGNVGFVNKVVIVRYNPDGGLDNTFDGDGMVSTAITANECYARALALQADGKIIVAGDARSAVNEDFFVARYNPDGSPDNSFDGDGKVVTPVGTRDDIAFAVAIQPDGKILAAGLRANNVSPWDDFAIVRYMPDGTLDNSFDSDGKAMLDIGGPGFERVLGMAVANNRIYVGGACQSFSIGFYVFAVAAIRMGATGLPLSLTDFTAAVAGNEIDLLWHTASEQNTEVFSIERSNDGVHYSGIGQVLAAGNSQSDKRYAFIDPQPFIGINYYRLKMVDKDGSFAYSKVVAARTNIIAGILHFFPNPAKNNLYLQTHDLAGPVQLSISNASGVVVRKEFLRLTGNNSFTLDIRGLPAGNYYLVLQLNDHKEVQGFIKL